MAGRSLSETAADFIKAMEGLLGAGLYVGVARGISVALTAGQILDTMRFAIPAALLVSVVGLVGVALAG